MEGHEQEAIDMFYEEEVHYDYKTGKSKDGYTAGHFTQLVWLTSTEVGFGVSNKTNGSNFYYIVANYYKRGNFLGNETNNVFPQEYCQPKPKEEKGMSGVAIFFIIIGVILVLGAGFLAFLYFSKITIGSFNFRAIVEGGKMMM
ncbi:MAG: CAP domain-containing protein [archaeon]|nr:CAP domain-containing protein [archaeon]